VVQVQLTWSNSRSNAFEKLAKVVLTSSSVDVKRMFSIMGIILNSKMQKKTGSLHTQSADALSFNLFMIDF